MVYSRPMTGRYHCERCDHDFDSDDARCPQCLRKSTVVDRDAMAAAAFIESATEDDELDVTMILLRIVLVGLQLSVLLPLGWLLFEHERWIDDHGLNLSIGAAMMAWGFFTIQLGFRMRAMMSEGRLTAARVVKGQLGSFAFTLFQAAVVAFAGWVPIALFGPELSGWAHLISLILVWILTMVLIVVVLGRVFQGLKRLSPSFSRWAEVREAEADAELDRRE